VGFGELRFTLTRAQDDEALRKRIASFVQKADLQINDFTIHKLSIREKMVLDGIPDSIQKDILAKIEGSEDPTILHGKTVHKGVDADGQEIDVTFDMDDESDGTKKFFALAGPILYVLENGCTLIADELGMRLHPLLTRALIGLFHTKETNPLGAQLLFTSHDSSLLEEPAIFRRDQVWMTEKDETGATSLSSLWDYRVRKGENMMRAYLAGRYGAVPFVEDLKAEATGRDD
jgi:AAA15 family ATPase/GTPase